MGLFYDIFIDSSYKKLKLEMYCRGILKINPDKATKELRFMFKGHQWSGMIRPIKYYIQQGADTNVKIDDLQGITLLHWASDATRFSYKHSLQLEVLTLLLKKARNVDVLDSNSCTLLHYVTANPSFLSVVIKPIQIVKIIELLVVHGACIDSKDNNQKTPLDNAFFWRSAAGITGVQCIIRLQVLKQPNVEIPTMVLNEPNLLEYWQSCQFQANNIRDTFNRDGPAMLLFDNIVLNMIQGKNIDEIRKFLNSLDSEYPLYADFLSYLVCEAFCNQYAYNKLLIGTKDKLKVLFPNKDIYPVIKMTHRYVIDNENKLLASLVQECSKAIISDPTYGIVDATRSVSVSNRWQRIFAETPGVHQRTNS